MLDIIINVYFMNVSGPPGYFSHNYTRTHVESVPTVPCKALLLYVTQSAKTGLIVLSLTNHNSSCVHPITFILHHAKKLYTFGIYMHRISVQ